MIKNNFSLGAVLYLGVFALLSCGGQPKQPQTLGDIDTRHNAKKIERATKVDKEQDEIKQAYYDYISGAAKDDRFRLQAATRIAELELSLENQKTTEEQFEQTVRQTITLLEDALRDFPDAQGNDHSMYQLAKAYDQIAETEKAVDVLNSLVNQYPHSPYYTEAKFRIAENAFINNHYFKSEDAYTDVLKNPENDIFFEKALFKRGWSRFKQELYPEALDDFYDAIYRHNFAELEDLKGAEKELFEEYFRAIALSFTYMGGTDAIYAYHREQSDPIYIYQTYETVAQLLYKQERISDTVAAYTSYSKYYPKGDQVIQAGLNTLGIWKKSGFFERYVEAFGEFYNRYSTGSTFWTDPSIKNKEAQQKLAIDKIREHVVLLAGYYHNQYLKRPSRKGFSTAQQWYTRYLNDYGDYARKDKVNQLYAELLMKAGENKDALHYFELAAFDGDIVLDKESAYSAIYLSDLLYKKNINASDKSEERAELLDKHLRYALQYSAIYPGESHTPEVVKNAVELAAKADLKERVIELANTLPSHTPKNTAEYVGLLKAQAYFDLGKLDDAELVYIDLLANREITSRTKLDLVNKLALVLYKQGETAKSKQEMPLAKKYFLRVYHELPDSDLAPTALYDAATLMMKTESWTDAINYLNAFKQTYPSSPFQQDVAKKLSFAYLKADRTIEAARAFEEISDFVSEEKEKMAALWQAAQLYYQKDQLQPALRAFKEYAHTYKRPYAENMEAMHTISDIYQRIGEREKKAFWLRKIIRSDSQASSGVKTDRTVFITANAAYSLAYLRRDDFSQIRLRIPLSKSLKAKKSAMQDSVKLYGKAAGFGLEEFVTPSTLAIAEIYEEFAVALMDSERPKNLNEEELEQYDILIEDQVFPFEDKAIEFHEANVKRIALGTYDQSVKKSLEKLVDIYPTRYGRTPKVEMYVPILEEQ